MTTTFFLPTPRFQLLLTWYPHPVISIFYCLTKCFHSITYVLLPGTIFALSSTSILPQILQNTFLLWPSNLKYHSQLIIKVEKYCWHRWWSPSPAMNKLIFSSFHCIFSHSWASFTLCFLITGFLALRRNPVGYESS